MAKPEQLECLIFAAGASRRFGSCKMLYELDHQRTILQATVDRYLRVFDSVSVVLETPRGAVAKSLNGRRIKIIACSESGQGMSQSIVAGVKASTPELGWLLALGDMPYVAVDSIKKIIESLHLNTIVIPAHNARPGNPVAFGLQFKERLLELQGDRGAKSVILSNSDRVVTVETNDKGIHQDIDVPQDIIR